ncbi:MAG TPA: GNAT family protein [Chitinophagaceae bacterium]|nr:GNAT family protein [Chitinophagaceae bacterium]
MPDQPAIDYLPMLENQRVRLQPLGMGDLDELEAIALEPSLWKLSLSSISSRRDLEAYIQLAIRERETGRSIPFVILDRQDNRKAGSTRFMDISLAHKRLEIGSTWIGEKYQRTGLNRWMKLAMLDHAFDVLGLNRVDLKTDALNERSRNAMLGIGATQEGIFRRHMITAAGRVRDTVYFSIIREEWPLVRSKLLHKMN